VLQTRRLKLQYFLLHGNQQLSHFPLESLLHHLGAAVWGLTVSLTDVAHAHSSSSAVAKTTSSS
jgi:hypothetical protein